MNFYIEEIVYTLLVCMWIERISFMCFDIFIPRESIIFKYKDCHIEISDNLVLL